MSQSAAAVTLTPIEMLKNAVASVRRRDITVRAGTLGVVNIGFQGWKVDPYARTPGISPIGALLLQSGPKMNDIASLAAAQALGVSLAWSEGLRDGVNLEKPDKGWTTSESEHEYLRGYESGVTLRLHIGGGMAGPGR